MGIAARVDSMRGDELLGRVVHKALVKILAAELHVAVGGQGTKGLAVNFQNCDIKRSASEIVNDNSLRARRLDGRTLRFSPINPKAIAAAVGSLMMSCTSSPANRPAS